MWRERQKQAQIGRICDWARRTGCKTISHPLWRYLDPARVIVTDRDPWRMSDPLPQDLLPQCLSCYTHNRAFRSLKSMRAPFVCLNLIVAVALAGQTAAPVRPTFDVVSVKPSPPGRGSRRSFQSECSEGGRYISHGTPLLWAIDWAYGLNDYQVVPGWPDWLNSFDTYDVDAIANGRATEHECRLMLQSLFEDRFRLRVHWARKTVTAFALIPGRKGPRLRTGGRVIINGEVKQAASEIEAPDGWTMPRLANYLASVRGIGMPVLDKTGLTGVFGLALSYSIADDDGRPDIFSALPDQLGLRLQAIRAPVDMFVIDHVEHPTGN